MAVSSDVKLTTGLCWQPHRPILSVRPNLINASVADSVFAKIRYPRVSQTVMYAEASMFQDLSLTSRYTCILYTRYVEAMWFPNLCQNKSKPPFKGQNVGQNMHSQDHFTGLRNSKVLHTWCYLLIIELKHSNKERKPWGWCSFSIGQIKELLNISEVQSSIVAWPFL